MVFPLFLPLRSQLYFPLTALNLGDPFWPTVPTATVIGKDFQTASLRLPWIWTWHWLELFRFQFPSHDLPLPTRSSKSGRHSRATDPFGSRLLQREKHYSVISLLLRLYDFSSLKANGLPRQRI